MTRKDYELIAQAIKACNLSSGNAETVARELAKALQADNPRFARDRFFVACGCSTAEPKWC